ncbi:MAG: diphosphomevalonate decarboxylase [Rickettsiales bacterium]|nr:diphosphomevalonate decarboxylase [Rickettsiales bacterium]|tara:strand:+ start:584 stop:1579 length:996 start_codon:yes stop_codon:yes gene_type:complete
MSERKRASARACSNIAFIKYWGKLDYDHNVPLNDSISMNLSAAVTTTTVEWDSALSQDEIYLEGERVLDQRAVRISRYLDRIRSDWYRMGARVASVNSFPAGTGIASSASGFAALATAAIGAFGEGHPEEQEMTRWARRGSGSACRSIQAGFVEWVAGKDDASSFSQQFCPPEHWDLTDLVVLVSRSPKAISSSEGHRIAVGHPFMEKRQQLLPARILALKGALAQRDFVTFGELVEHEAMEMHAIMISGQPSALYLQPGTVALMHAVRSWREHDGLPVYFTLDAGPNMHVLCESRHAPEVRARIEATLPRADILENRAGPGATLHDDHLF